MKKFLLFVFAPLVILASCSKDNKFDASKQAAADDAAIKAYIGTDTAFHATADGSGVYYKIVTAGTGDHPKITSTVKVTYTGKLLDGSTFQSATITQGLSGLIAGWQSGIPYAKTGGRIILVIPSRAGYGNSAAGSIPANSVLVFTIDLLSFS
ncbi:FKBP-type peptidyl-prolyl cis-trans isomerase [Mucilaginibacter angelicae]|uniref:Peptidyl-prolyl cis-trans isomerase n=1 Tax=Mucilaginibacter angelicae TaxID=869718 RepID=A0ABV6LAG7_9SPHI